MAQRSLGRWVLGAAAVLLLVALGSALLRPDGSDADERLVRKGVVVGVIANTLDGGDGDRRAVRAAGFRWVREELRWSELEPRRGRFDWRTSDRLFRDTARRGLRVLPLLLESPRWLSRDALALPPDAAAFARYVAAAAARYGPGGRFWRTDPSLDARLAPAFFEVWNEPWFRFFSTQGIEPARFARLARAAIEAGHAANPRARFLLPVEGPYARDDGEVADWVDDLAAADPDLGRIADGFAVHPYDDGDPRSTEGDRRGQFRRLDDVRAGLRRHGWRTGPIWITEVGWSTCARRPLCVSEADQRRHWTALLRLVREGPADVAAVFAYHFLNTGQPDPRTSGNHFGLLRHDRSRKPAFEVVARAGRQSAR